MKDIKAVFFDIDGTLVSFNTHTIPQSTLQAVATLRRKGVKVYIATGRPLAFIDNLGALEYDGMITVTGAHCFDVKGHVIHHQSVTEDTLHRVAHYLTLHQDDDKSYPLMVVCDDEMFITAITPQVEQIATLLNIKLPPVREPHYMLGRDVLQLISFFPIRREKELMSDLMRDCTSMRWHDLFTDVVHQEVSKSTGIRKVLDYEGIRLDEAMAFGDGGNDIAMLKYVPCSIAMGNASPQVKASASYVTTSVDEDGIYNALKHFGLLE